MTPGVVKSESNDCSFSPDRGKVGLGHAITQRDDRDPRKLRRLLHRFDQVSNRGDRVVGLVGRVVHDDRRTGGDRVRPLDVERGLADNVGFGVVTPFWSTTWKLGGAGIPKNWSKVVRSAPSVGSTPSSTMAIVWPAPSPGTVRAAGAREIDLVDAIGLPKLRRADLTAEERQLRAERYVSDRSASI